MTTRRLSLLIALIACWVLYAFWAKGTSETKADIIVEAGTVHDLKPDTTGMPLPDTLPKKAGPGPVAPVDTTRKVRANSEQQAVEDQGTPAVCPLAGITFNQHAPGRDRLTITASGSRRVEVTGTVNSISVSGTFRVSGASLTAIKGGNSIVGGTLTLENDCAKLTGNITIISPRTGRTTTERVDLFDPRKGG